MSYADYSSSIIQYMEGSPSLSLMTNDSGQISTWVDEQRRSIASFNLGHASAFTHGVRGT